MRRLPDGRVIHMQIVADRPNDHFPGIKPHPDLDLNLVGLADLVGVCPDRLLHGQSRIAGPHRMIFVGNRRAKERHNAVAHDLVDGAFVAVYRLHQAFQHGIQELAGFLGVAVGQEFHRALEIGKQHRHLLAFAFQGTARGQNFLRQIGGRVGQRDMLGRLDWGSRWRGCRVSVARPEQSSALLITHLRMRVEEFVLEILEGGIIELKLPLQRSICHTLALAQEVNHVIKEGIKVHLVSSLGLPSQTRVPVLAHLICASMYHSRGKTRRARYTTSG